MGQCLGECQGGTDRTREALPQHVIQALGVIGFPCFLCDGAVPLRWHHTLVRFILVRMQHGLFPVYYWDLGPQLFGTVATASANRKCGDLTGFSVYGDPDPWLVGLLHNAPHRISFDFQRSNDYVCWPSRQLDLEVIGTGSNTLDHHL
jgi:hypothetical protein